MEQNDYIKESLDIKDPNITFETEFIKCFTHREYQAKLDYDAPNCPACQEKRENYDFQKPYKIPYLEMGGFKVLIRLKKRRFRCKTCGKIQVAKTSLVRENHQIPNIINHKITEKLMGRKAMTKIAEDLSVSLSTVYRQLERFESKTDWTYLPEVMSWDEYAFKKGKMSFIAQDYQSKKLSLSLIDVLKLSSEITSCAILIRCGAVLKSSPWICLAPIIAQLKNYFQTPRLSQIDFTSSKICHVP